MSRSHRDYLFKEVGAAYAHSNPIKTKYILMDHWKLIKKGNELIVYHDSYSHITTPNTKLISTKIYYNNGSPFYGSRGNRCCIHNYALRFQYMYKIIGYDNPETDTYYFRDKCGKILRAPINNKNKRHINNLLKSNCKRIKINWIPDDSVPTKDKL